MSTDAQTHKGTGASSPRAGGGADAGTGHSPVPAGFPPGVGRRFLLAYAALFVPFAITTPYLQKLLALRGFAPDRIGLILGCFEAMAVVAPPVWGYLSDRTHRPRLILGLCIAAGAPVFALFNWVQGFPAALAVAVLFGLFYRSLIPLTDGITFRFIHRHGGDYGRIRIGGSMGFIACMLLVEPLGLGSSRDGALIIAAVVGACLLHLLSVGLLPAAEAPPEAGDAGARTCRGGGAGGAESVPHEGLLQALRAIAQPAFVWFTLCVFLCRVAMMAYYGFFTLYLANDLGIQAAGFIWLLGPLSEIPIIYWSRPIMARIGVRNLFALGLVGVAVRLGGFSLAEGLWAVIPLQFLHSLTFGAYHCASVTYVSRVVPPRLQSTAQTLFAGITVGGGMMVGGALGGMVARQAGFRPMFAAAAVLAVLTLGLLLWKVPRLDAVRRGGNAQR